MKKWFVLLLAMLLMLSLTPAFAEEEAAEDLSVEAITEKGTFVLGLDDSFPPMGYRNEDNEIVGFDIDVAAAVCERLGVELVVQPIEWSAKELELSSKKIDCIWNGMSINPEREESMSLTDAYLNNKMVLVVKKDAGYASREDLAGKIVGVQNGSQAEKMLNEDPSLAEFKDSIAESLGFEDYLTVLMDLQNGQVDAVFIDQVVAEFQIANLNDDNLTVIENLGDDLYAVGFRKEDVALRDKVNAILKEMKADGTLAEISTKWFGSDITIIEAE